MTIGNIPGQTRVTGEMVRRGGGDAVYLTVDPAKFTTHSEALLRAVEVYLELSGD